METVLGALELADGRLLSWGYQRALRLWDSQMEMCVAILEGHAGVVDGALELPNGRLLSWACDHTLRLWEQRTGACLEVVAEHELACRRPDYAMARSMATNLRAVAGEFHIVSSNLKVHVAAMFRMLLLLHGFVPGVIASWESDQVVHAECLLPDGTAVLKQADGQICILKLQHGNRRFSLAEAQSLLTSQMNWAE